MIGVLLQGFGVGGRIGLIIADGYGVAAIVAPGTAQAGAGGGGGGHTGPNEESMRRKRRHDEEFDAEMRWNFRRLMGMEEPETDEPAAPPAPAAKPGPQAQRTINRPTNPLMAALIAKTQSPNVPPSLMQKFQIAQPLVSQPTTNRFASALQASGKPAWRGK